VALWALGFVRASVRARTGGCGSGSSLTQRRSTSSELLTAYDMPVDEQTHLDQAWRDQFLSTLLGRPPVFVLHLLADAVVSLLDLKNPDFTGGGQLGTEFGLEASKNMEGIVEIVTSSPSLILGDEDQVDTGKGKLGDETQVDTGKGKLNDGTSDGTVAKRESSSRMLDVRSASVDLVLKPHWALVYDLPFSGSSPGGLHSVSRRDLYLDSATAESGVSLRTILEGTPTEAMRKLVLSDGLTPHTRGYGWEVSECTGGYG
jgi:hypothetical protein